MEKPPPQKAPRRHRTAVAVVVILLLVTVGYLLLPAVVERAVVPAVFRAAGIRDYALPVRRMGFFQTDLGTLRIGTTENPGITAVSIAADYTPAGLLGKHIRRIVLEGVEVRLQVSEDGTFEIPGLPFDGGDADAEPVSGPADLPVMVDRIELRQGVVRLAWGERQIRVPIEATLRTDSDGRSVEYAFEAVIFDAPFQVTGQADLGGRTLTTAWESGDLAWDRLVAIFAPDAPIGASGNASVSGSARAALFPFQPVAVESTVRSTSCRLNLGDIRLVLSGDVDDADFWVSARTSDAKGWQIAASPVRVFGPGFRALLGLEGAFGLTDGGSDWEGMMTAAADVDTPESDTPVNISYRITTRAAVAPDGRWHASADGRPGADTGDRVAISTANARIEAGLPEIVFTAAGEGRTAGADIRWDLPGLSLKTDAGRMRLPTLSGEGRLDWEASAATGGFSVATGPAVFRGDGVNARLNRIQLTGSVSSAPSGLAVDALLNLRGGSATAAAADFQVRGVQARIPVKWPLPERGKPGTLSLAELRWKERHLGGVSGRVRQRRDTLTMDLRHESRMIPGLRLTAAVAAGPGDEENGPFVRMNWQADRSDASGALALADLLPDPPEIPILFNASLRTEGQAAYENGGLTGAFTASLDSGRLQIDEPGFAIDGIRTVVAFPDINRIRSAPFQQLAFDAATLGSVRIENGRVDYQIEPAGTVFVEDARFDWSGGTIIMPATRFTAGVDDYDVTVYCDRLKLDRLLEQLGVAKAEGGGAISGLIPVKWADGQIRFENAFLYSTPGEGGVIRVEGSEILTAGIPPGTPQYNQMELARHALKDYDYKWAKIVMNTVEDDLLLELQFDGKPAEPLPFVYRPEAGGFVRTGPDHPGSVFQGIRLDVNFRLPLNRLLRYREVFKRLQ